MVAVVEVDRNDSRGTSARKPDRDAMHNELNALVAKEFWTEQDIRRMNELGKRLGGRFLTSYGAVVPQYTLKSGGKHVSLSYS